MKRLFASAAFLFLSVFAAQSQQRGLKVEKPVTPPSQLSQVGNDSSEESVIGMSYDSTLKDFTNNKCVTKISGPANLGQPKSQHSSVSVTEVSNESKYANSTSMSLSAAYNSGVASGNASASYVSSGKMNSYDSTALLSSDVWYEPQQYAVSNFKLTENAIRYLTDGYASFRLYCGDHFTIGFNRGANFIATLTIRNSSDSEQSQTNASVNAGNASGSVNATFSQFIADSSKSGRLSYEVTRDGLTDTAPNLNADDLVDYARTYATKIDALPTKPIGSYIFGDYLSLIRDALGDKKLKIDIQPYLLLLNDQYTYLFSLYRYRADLMYLSEHPEEFAPIDPVKVSRQETIISTEIDSVTSWGINCIMSKGEVCPDRRSQDLKTPGYSVPRARPWTQFVPTDVQPQQVGIADPDMILELKGRWGNAPNSTVDITYSSNIILQKGADPPQTLPTVPRMVVSKGTAASFRFNDFGPSDNWVYAKDPAEGRLGAPLDDFVAGK